MLYGTVPYQYSVKIYHVQYGTGTVLEYPSAFVSPFLYVRTSTVCSIVKIIKKSVNSIITVRYLQTYFRLHVLA